MARAAHDAVLEIDVRGVLPAVTVPTRVLHRIGDAMPIEGARYIAATVPDGALVELPGSDHYWWMGEPEPLLDAIEEFVTGVAPRGAPDRSLTTLMFTDIVGSTDHLVRVGDRAWREVLNEHDRLTREQVHRHRGNVVDSAGDGFLATFDGPGRAIRCAQAIHHAVTEAGLQVRIGLHTGEVERRGDGVAGLSVHVAARVAALAEGRQTLVSRTVTELVAGAGIGFRSVGTRNLKGVPGQWELFEVGSVPPGEYEQREPTSHLVRNEIDEPAPAAQRIAAAVAARRPGLVRRLTNRLYEQSRRDPVDEQFL
jgi:class 3 adenylate cyclase